MRIGAVAKLLGVSALVLLLAACVKVNMKLEVSEDNTVGGSMIFAVDQRLLQLTGGSVDDLLQGSLTPLEGTEGVTVADYEDGGFVGKEFSFESVPLSQFSGSGSDELSIVRRGNEFVVSGQLDLSSSEFGGGDTSQIPPGLLDSFEFTIQITFPGEVKSASGDIDGNTVTFEPAFGENNRIEAVASAIPSAGSSVLLILLIVAGLLIVGAIAFLLMKGRRAAPVAGPIGDGEGMETPVEGGTTAPIQDAPAAPPAGPIPGVPEAPGSAVPPEDEEPRPPVPPASG